MTFDLIADIYVLTQNTENGEPTDDPPTLLYKDEPGCWMRLSGNTRYLAAGAGIALAGRWGMAYKPDVTARCLIMNVRSREGEVVPGEADAYRVVYPNVGRRRYHLELDVEAWMD